MRASARRANEWGTLRTACTVALGCVLAACGASVQPARTTVAPPVVNAVRPTPTAREDVAVRVREEDKHRALFQSAFGITTVHDITVWAREEHAVWLAAFTTDERNTAPATFWMRVDDAGAVLSKGEIGMSYPRALRLVDVTADGEPELLIFGIDFTGADPYSPSTVHVYTRASDAAEPEPLARPGAALTAELDAQLSAMFVDGKPDAPLGPLPDAATIQRAVVRADAFTPRDAPASPGLFALGLQHATNAQLRESISPGGLQLCRHTEDWAYDRCSTLTARQLTDVVLNTRVRPLIGRMRVRRSDVAPPGTLLWSSSLLNGNRVKYSNDQSSVWCEIEHTDTGNRLRTIVTRPDSPAP